MSNNSERQIETYTERERENMEGNHTERAGEGQRHRARELSALGHYQFMTSLGPTIRLTPSNAPAHGNEKFGRPLCAGSPPFIEIRC